MNELKEKRNHIPNVLLKNKASTILEKIQQINDKVFWDFRVVEIKEISKSAYQIFGENLVVAFSGVKDSLAALHLALHTISPKIPVVFSSTTIEFPDTIQYVQKLAKEWNLNLHIVKPKKPFFSSCKRAGMGLS